MDDKSDNQYDVALVLGSGIKPGGAIPESAKIRTQKAVELLQKGIVSHVIFSGKWTYNLDYVPSLTEAEAMANYGQSLGLESSQYLLEKESVTTVSNFCNIKKLMKEHNWQSALLVINRPYQERAFLNMQKVFGPDYTCDYVLTDFRFPPEKERELEKLEEKKITDAKVVFSAIADGDDETILKVTSQDLQSNYLK